MFDSDNIAKLSKENSFVQRVRKVTAISLLESVLFSGNDPSKVSLNDMAIYHRIHYGIKLTRQSIGKRFNKNATEFLKQLLVHLLKVNLSESIPIFTCSKFGRITIKDSTCNQLPENLKNAYPESGGAGSKASVRVQFEYDLKNLEVLNLTVSAFNDQDNKNAKDTLDDIKKDDLVIRDLGYVTMEILKAIEKREAWYISRLNASITVSDESTGEQLDFSAIEEYMKKNKLSSIEKYVLLGEKKYRTRLIIETVPTSVKEERIRKATKESKKKGRKISKDKKARFGLNLFLTNCTAEILSASEIRKIYGIRWQIEMIFKAWKQNSQFHKIKKINVDRFEFLLYAKLILIMLQWKIYQAIDITTYSNVRERISILKMYKTFKQFIENFKDILRGNIDRFTDMIICLKEIATDHLKHEDRKNRINWRLVENI